MYMKQKNTNLGQRPSLPGSSDLRDISGAMITWKKNGSDSEVMTAFPMIKVGKGEEEKEES